MDKEVIKTKAKELIGLRNDLYSGIISGREYQNKKDALVKGVKEAFGDEGLMLLHEYEHGEDDKYGRG